LFDLHVPGLSHIGRADTLSCPGSRIRRRRSAKRCSMRYAGRRAAVRNSLDLQRRVRARGRRIARRQARHYTLAGGARTRRTLSRHDVDPNVLFVDNGKF
jgi:hypothetical protein